LAAAALRLCNAVHAPIFAQATAAGASPMSVAATERKVKVWDAPTRIFHWSLVILIVVAWLTGEEEGAAAFVHRIAGEALAGLLVFRLIWGFIGGEHARFSDFAAGPTAIMAHVKDLLSGNPKRHLGHNPLGGAAVFLLIALTSLVVLTGLFSGSDHQVGPFAGMWGLQLSELHEVLFRVLQAVVVIHLIGVAAETFLSKDKLVPAMITGAKKRRDDEPATDAKSAPMIAFLIAAAIGVAASAMLMNIPGPDPSSFESEHDHDEDH
jgi:cytochrome b